MALTNVKKWIDPPSTISKHNVFLQKLIDFYDTR